VSTQVEITTPCGACGGLRRPSARWRRFKDGSHHIEARCSACNSFLMWAPQTTAWRTLAGPVAVGGQRHLFGEPDHE
jgi:hypothetical protein